MLEALGPLAAQGLAGGVIDSYETGMQNWTREFPQEFSKRRGYELVKYLPAMTGRVVESAEVTERYLWDIRRTCADLMGDYYYGRFAERCRQNKLKAYAEPYSGGPFDEIMLFSKDPREDKISVLPITAPCAFRIREDIEVARV